MDKTCNKMDHGRLLKEMFDSKLGGIRRKKRPRLRWLEDVEKNLREINVNRWRQQRADREEWVSVITEAKALRELCCTTKD